MQTIESLFAQYGLVEESESAFQARLERLLEAASRKSGRRVNTIEELQGDVIPVRDYAMPALYTTPQRAWPVFSACAIFENGVTFRATVGAHPDKGVNTGHAIRTLARFYRGRREVNPYGIPIGLHGIPVPPLAVLTFDGKPVSDIDEANRILVQTVPYDPNEAYYDVNESLRSTFKVIQYDNMRRDADRDNEIFDSDQYREALAENARLDRIATQSVAA